MGRGECGEGGTRHVPDKACQSVHGRLSGTQSLEEEGKRVGGHQEALQLLSEDRMRTQFREWEMQRLGSPENIHLT